MPTLSNNLATWWRRHSEHIDHVVCVGIFFTAGMPAIVIMLLLSLPLLPFIGFCFCLGASFPSKQELSLLEDADDTAHRGQSDRPGPGAATPHYA